MAVWRIKNDLFCWYSPLELTKPKFICNLTVPILQIWKPRLRGRKGLAQSHLGKLGKLPRGDAPQTEQPI